MSCLIPPCCKSLAGLLHNNGKTCCGKYIDQWEHFTWLAQISNYNRVCAFWYFLDNSSILGLLICYLYCNLEKIGCTDCCNVMFNIIIILYFVLKLIKSLNRSVDWSGSDYCLMNDWVHHIELIWIKIIIVNRDHIFALAHRYIFIFNIHYNYKLWFNLNDVS